MTTRRDVRSGSGDHGRSCEAAAPTKKWTSWPTISRSSPRFARVGEVATEEVSPMTQAVSLINVTRADVVIDAR
jgi:hypothetical protein